jgi:hypothetical protein
MTSSTKLTCKAHPGRPLWALAAGVLLALALPSPRASAAQEMPPETSAPPPAQPGDTAPRKPPAAGPPASAQQSPPASQPAQAEPEKPNWPVNLQPERAEVTWDSHGLSIDASNSSLQQIMRDVSTATGTRVEGLNGDERIFGAYGPGQARDVLGQLLQGAGYNVMLIGDQGQGVPRQIVLTQRHASADDHASQPKPSSDNDDDLADPDDEQPQQPPMRPGFPGGFPRNPQQRMEQFQRERQLMQQQQQQPQPQQPQQPQTPPQN